MSCFGFRIYVLSLFFLILFPSLHILPASATAFEFDYGPISHINLDAINDHLTYLSKLGSRLTGYPGADEAAEYIHGKFVECGLLNVTYQSFNVTVPIDHGANLTILSPKDANPQAIDLYPFWPNLVAPVKTPPGGLIGQLIYVGDGSLQEFEDKPIEGNIVLMNFNTQYRWINAAKLGAKAVVFIEPEDTVKEQARMKILDTIPFNFPRLLARTENAKMLVHLLEEENVTVRLESDMRWEVREGRNIIGYVKGNMYPDLYILYTSHYDSFGYVPSLAPGAQTASGVASLLEMAKFFGANPAKYSIIFIAFSGTYQNLAGSTKYVDEKLRMNFDTFGKKAVLQLNLDLNTYTDILAGMTVGFNWATIENIAPWARYIISYEQELRADIENKLKKKFSVEEVGFVTSAYAERPVFPSLSGNFFAPLDHEPLMILQGPGISWMTARAHNAYWGTWLDTLERINLENLKTQLEYLYPLFYAIANTENLRPDYVPEWAPTYGSEGRWDDITVQLAEFQEGWYKPVPNALLALGTLTWGDHVFGFRFGPGYVIYKSDENGRVTLCGVPQKSRGGVYSITGYVVDPDTGNVVYAPDFGKHWFAGYITPNAGKEGTNTVLIMQPKFQDLGVLTLFKCGSIVVFDFDDPYHSNAPIISSTFSLNDIRSHNEPDSWGLVAWRHGGTAVTVSMFFAPINTPVEILFNRGRFPLGLLLNTTEENAQGTGYILKEYGSQTILPNTPLRIAIEVYRLNEARVSKLASSKINIESVRIHRQVEELIKNAQTLLNQEKYAQSYAYAAEAWRLSRDVYVDVRLSQENAVLTVPFFAFLIVPFVFFFERLTFTSVGLKRLLTLLGVYIVLFLILWFLHPGFSLASDVMMVMLVAVVIILSLPILGIIFNGFVDLAKSLRKKVMGAHFYEVGYGSSLLISFEAGVRYMKKRKFRTFFILLSLTIITGGFIPFLSLSTITFTKFTPAEAAPLYNGILMRHEKWGRQFMGGWSAAAQGSISVGERVIQQIEGKYGNLVTVIPRAWLYYPSNPIQPMMLISRDGRTFPIYSILGLTAKEAEMTHVDDTLTDGRWFMENESKYACIIGKETASLLGIDSLPATVSFQGLNLAVVGIVDDSSFRELKDLDGEELTPITRRVANPNMDIHHPMSEVIIVPYQSAMDLGGWIMSVVIKVDDESQIQSVAQDLFNRFQISTYAGFDRYIINYSRGTTFEFLGWMDKILPLVLAALTILNVMLGSVYERKKDMETFSVVGLNPFQIALLFFYEATIYAVLGSVFGYLLSLAAIVGGTYLMPSIFVVPLNYASALIINALGICMIATISSVIYPMFRSAKIVTPSLERKWKPPTRPAGDMWDVPLPFICETDTEANGILTYLHEFFQAHRSEEAESFYVKDVRMEREEIPDRIMKILTVAGTVVAPYEMGVSQDVKIIDSKELETGRHDFRLHITRTGGELDSWQTLNMVFIDHVRKQMLLWRSLRGEERRKYEERGVEIQ